MVISNSKKRLNLDLTPEAYRMLQQLADASGKTVGNLMRSGLAEHLIKSLR